MDEFMPSINDKQLLDMVDDFIQTASNRHSALEGVIGLLASNYRYYTWAGIYLLQDGVLNLGPYRGDPSPHTTITIDKGICGAAVRERQTIIVSDTKADPRFLACSLSTNSEIVVPIFKGDKVVGEIDIDSDEPDAFQEHDRQILEVIAGKLSQLF